MRVVLIGLVAGLFSALFGVGGGILIVPLLLFLTSLDGRAATATSLASIILTALSGVIAYAIHGDVHVPHALLIGVPGAVAAVAGTTLQQRIHTRTLEFLFSGLLAGVACWLLVK